uniref:Uncharacterized protein n=1 Tax=Anguilla anguilla TaxID=7936 RepID=A0A0E9VT65_ANGAN
MWSITPTLYSWSFMHLGVATARSSPQSTRRLQKS